MAMYEPDPVSAKKNLDQADALLASAAGKVAQIDIQEERAHVLRVRIERAIDAGDTVSAQKMLVDLKKIATQATTETAQRTYHGAAGTLLVAQKNYADAIPELEEDVANPLSMKLLITAYRETGDADEASNLSRKLNGWKVPSVEEALATADKTPHTDAVAAQSR